MAKMFTVTLKEAELKALAAMVKRNLHDATDKRRRRMLGLLYDELCATLDMEIIAAAQKNVRELEELIAATAKAEKRKHLRVVK